MPLNKARHQTSLYITALVLLGAFTANVLFQTSNFEIEESWRNTLSKNPQWMIASVEEDTSDSDVFLPEDHFVSIAESNQAAPLVRYLRATHNMSSTEAIAILASAIKYSGEHKIPLDLVLAIIDEESDFNPNAKSYVGARGLMQVMPVVHKKKIYDAGGTYDLLWNPDFNMKIGTSIYKECLSASKGNVYEALARYNGSWINTSESVQNIYSEKVLKTKSKYTMYVQQLK